MGALPKRKISKARRDRRRAHDFLPQPHLVACDNCGEVKKPHYICDNCGTYKGRQILPESED